MPVGIDKLYNVDEQSFAAAIVFYKNPLSALYCDGFIIYKY